MRVRTAFLIFASVFASCSSGSGTPDAHPDGWSASSTSPTAFTSGAQRFELRKKPFDGTIKDFASALTTSTILGNRHAKLTSSVGFPDCPGEAGLQHYQIGGAKPGTLEIGFTVTGNHAITASYFRPPGTSESTAAKAAMKTDVCTVVV